MRSEGHMGFMAAVCLTQKFINILLYRLLISAFCLDLAGAALGSVMAKGITLLAIFIFRWFRQKSLSTPVFLLTRKMHRGRRFLALGAPSSFNYIGFALSAAMLFSLQLYKPVEHASTVANYSVLTRIMTFVFFPLLGLSLAFHSTALALTLLYGLIIQSLLWVLKDSVGGWFVNNKKMFAEVGRILPVMTAALFLLGPLMIISMFFKVATGINIFDYLKALACVKHSPEQWLTWCYKKALAQVVLHGKAPPRGHGTSSSESEERR